MACYLNFERKKDADELRGPEEFQAELATMEACLIEDFKVCAVCNPGLKRHLTTFLLIALRGIGFFGLLIGVIAYFDGVNVETTASILVTGVLCNFLHFVVTYFDT